MSAVYRPNKKNIKIQEFVQRMKKKNIHIEPAERFKYVIIKTLLNMEKNN